METGYYWILVKQDAACESPEAWEIAGWDGDQWWRVGCHLPMTDSPVKIGPRIPDYKGEQP